MSNEILELIKDEIGRYKNNVPEDAEWTSEKDKIASKFWDAGLDTAIGVVEKYCIGENGRRITITEGAYLRVIKEREEAINQINELRHRLGEKTRYDGTPFV